MASTTLENVPGVQNVKTPDLQDLKRKMKQQAASISKLAKTSGGRGERIEAVVFKRLPPKPTSGNGKAPPTKLIIMVVSPTVSIEIIGKKDGGSESNTGLTTGKVETGQVYWYGAFDLASNVTEGCRIVLKNPRGDIYRERLSLSGGAELKEKASINVVTSLDSACYRLPTLENMSTHSNVLLPINVERLQDKVTAFTVGYEDPSVYIKQDRTNVENTTLGAYVTDSKGYPFTVSWAEEDGLHTALVNIRLYDNHLVRFGIMNVEMWATFAPVLMESFVGCLMGYVNLDISNGMDINHGSRVEGCPYEYGLTVTATTLNVDMAATLKKVGFQVSADYVLHHFNDEAIVESDYFSTNILNKEKQVVNLSEYTGKLTTFTDNSEDWAFYALVNATPTEEEVLKKIREDASVEEREKALLGEDAAFKFSDKRQYIFAVPTN